MKYFSIHYLLFPFLFEEFNFPKVGLLPLSESFTGDIDIKKVLDDKNQSFKGSVSTLEFPKLPFSREKLISLIFSISFVFLPTLYPGSAFPIFLSSCIFRNQKHLQWSSGFIFYEDSTIDRYGNTERNYNYKNIFMATIGVSLLASCLYYLLDKTPQRIKVVTPLVPLLPSLRGWEDILFDKESLNQNCIQTTRAFNYLNSFKQDLGTYNLPTLTGQQNFLRNVFLDIIFMQNYVQENQDWLQPKGLVDSPTAKCLWMVEMLPKLFETCCQNNLEMKMFCLALKAKQNT